MFIRQLTATVVYSAVAVLAFFLLCDNAVAIATLNGLYMNEIMIEKDKTVYSK